MENKMMLVSRYVRLLALKSKAKPAWTIQNEEGRADGNLRQPYPDTYERSMLNHFILVCLLILSVRLS